MSWIDGAQTGKQEISQDKAEEFKLIPPSVWGNHGTFDTDVSTELEAASLKSSRCTKNPGHTNFIPVNDFCICDLPLTYQDQSVMDMVKLLSDLTVCVKSKHISDKRPHIFPGTSMQYPRHFVRMASGWVGQVDASKRNDQSCPCNKCQKSDEPAREWGRILVITSTHVVYDEEEANNTTCYLFHDSDTVRYSECPKIRGHSVSSDTQHDVSVLECITHDLSLVNTLQTILQNFTGLKQKVWAKYRSEDDGLKLWKNNYSASNESQLAIIVSHPHGSSKKVTIGEWKQRICFEKQVSKKSDCIESGGVMTVYKYTTPTCPGSSGGPVLLLGRKGWWFFWWCHLHSSSHSSGYNMSAAAPEWTALKTSHKQPLCDPVNSSCHHESNNQNSETDIIGKQLNHRRVDNVRKSKETSSVGDFTDAHPECGHSSCVSETLIEKYLACHSSHLQDFVTCPTHSQLGSFMTMCAQQNWTPLDRECLQDHCKTNLSSPSVTKSDLDSNDCLKYTDFQQTVPTPNPKKKSFRVENQKCNATGSHRVSEILKCPAMAISRVPGVVVIYVWCHCSVSVCFHPVENIFHYDKSASTHLTLTVFGQTNFICYFFKT